MPKKIIFSLDYDGCADILFDGVMDRYTGLFLKTELLRMRSKLEDFIEEKASGAASVEVYVGSNRQSKRSDEYAHSLNATGFCISNFSNLCKYKNTTSEAKWTFQPLLLADIDNNKPAGTAAQNVELKCALAKTKSRIIHHQLLDIAKNHPKDEVHMYFLDDDCENVILPELKEYFSKSQNAKLLSSNIHLHIVKFYWYGELAKNFSKNLDEFAHITNVEETSTVKYTSNKSLLFQAEKTVESLAVEVCDWERLVI